VLSGQLKSISVSLHDSLAAFNQAQKFHQTDPYLSNKFYQKFNAASCQTYNSTLKSEAVSNRNSNGIYSLVEIYNQKVSKKHLLKSTIPVGCNSVSFISVKI